MQNPKQIVHVEPDQFSFISQAITSNDLHATIKEKNL